MSCVQWSQPITENVHNLTNFTQEQLMTMQVFLYMKELNKTYQLVSNDYNMMMEYLFTNPSASKVKPVPDFANQCNNVKSTNPTDMNYVFDDLMQCMNIDDIFPQTPDSPTISATPVISPEAIETSGPSDSSTHTLGVPLLPPSLNVTLSFLEELEEMKQSGRQRSRAYRYVCESIYAICNYKLSSCEEHTSQRQHVVKLFAKFKYISYLLSNQATSKTVHESDRAAFLCTTSGCMNYALLPCPNDMHNDRSLRILAFTRQTGETLPLRCQTCWSEGF